MDYLDDQHKKDLDAVLNNKYFDSSEDAWDSKIARSALKDVTENWILRLADWKNFTTLTFEEETPPDKARRLLYSLINTLNEDLLGKHFKRKVKHSYFSYVTGIEYQKRDVIHFHMLADSPIHFDRIHSFWKYHAGFAWTEIIRDPVDVVQYIAKYTLKGGNIEVFQAKKRPVLKQYPTWWNEETPQMALPLG